MRRLVIFSVRLNAGERQLIANLAERLERSESDVVRLAIRDAARLHGLDPVISPSSAGQADRPRLPECG
jgi:hypothetical protein